MAGAIDESFITKESERLWISQARGLCLVLCRTEKVVNKPLNWSVYHKPKSLDTNLNWQLDRPRTADAGALEAGWGSVCDQASSIGVADWLLRQLLEKAGSSAQLSSFCPLQFNWQLEQIFGR